MPKELFRAWDFEVWVLCGFGFVMPGAGYVCSRPPLFSSLPKTGKEEEEPNLKRRDRSKQNKFNVLLAAGVVPASMRQEWEALKTAGRERTRASS